MVQMITIQIFTLWHHILIFIFLHESIWFKKNYHEDKKNTEVDVVLQFAVI